MHKDSSGILKMQYKQAIEQIFYCKFRVKELLFKKTTFNLRCQVLTFEIFIGRLK